MAYFIGIAWIGSLIIVLRKYGGAGAYVKNVRNRLPVSTNL